LYGGWGGRRPRAEVLIVQVGMCGFNDGFHGCVNMLLVNGT
jgi:hypothetical protein